MIAERLLVRIPGEKASRFAKGPGAPRRGFGNRADLEVRGHGCSCRDRSSTARPTTSRRWKTVFRLLGLARTFNRKGLVTDSDFGPFALLLSALDGNAVPGFVQQDGRRDQGL